MRKFPFFLLILFSYSISLAQDYDPQVIANSLNIEYGMHPDIILELINVYEEEGVSPQKREMAIKSLLDKYENLEPESKELTESDKKELRVSDKLFNILNFDFFTRVSSKGKFSPAVYAPGGKVEIWYGIAEKPFKTLWLTLEENEIKLLKQRTKIVSLQGESNFFQKKLEEYIQKYKNIESRLSEIGDYDEVYKKAKELLKEGNIEGAERILEEDVQKTNKMKASRNIQVGKIKELNLKFKEATSYYKIAYQLDSTNSIYSTYYASNLTTLRQYNLAIKIYNKSIKQISSNGIQDSSQLAVLYNNLGVIYVEIDSINQGEKYLKNGHEICPTDSIEIIIEILSNLATLFSSYEINSGLDMFIGLNSLFIKLYGEESEKSAQSFVRLANAYKANDNYSEALKYYKKAESIIKRVFDESHIRMIDIYEGLSIYFLHKKDLKKAQQYSEKMADIYYLIFKENHPQNSNLYSHLGIMYSHLKEYSKSLKYYDKAIHINVYHNLNKKNLAINYFNKAKILFNLKEHNKAIESLEKSLEVQRQIGSTLAIAVLMSKTYLELGKNYAELGIFLIAENKYEFALDLANSFGNSQTILIHDINANWGKLLHYHRFLHRALKRYKTALKYINQISNDEHKIRASRTYSRLALVYSDYHEYDSAIVYYLESLNIEKEFEKTDDKLLKALYNNIGVTYIDKKYYEKAIEYFYQVIDLEPDSLSTGEFILTNTFTSIGYAYHSLQKIDSALKYFKIALKIDLETYGIKNENLIPRYKNLASTYAARGNYGKSIELFQLATNIISTQSEETKSLKQQYGICLINYGVDLINQDSLLKARKQLERALELFFSIRDSTNSDMIYLSLGQSFLYQDDYANAVINFDRGLNVSNEPDSEYSETRILLMIFKVNALCILDKNKEAKKIVRELDEMELQQAEKNFFEKIRSICFSNN